ncbi:glutamate receptor ionotropic, delta-1 [Nephila pilipes]|uniref:Glutamate receptor ionotropic, delta-1 n=1 Tax=Nephila pilipes TaxID=299642 RepID=A0A8X6MYF9_NEPPI|nr:glutamate receptor ionotropic, delta-1 [Nephila pilipes]
MRTFPEKITVASLELKHIFEFPTGKDNDTKPKGIHGRFLEELSQVLQFKYDLISPPDMQWGRRLENGFWTGLVGIVSRGEADLAVSGVVSTKERQEVVDFTEPYEQGQATFASNLPSLVHRANIFTYPFDIVTWIGILVFLFIIPQIFRSLNAAKDHYLFALIKLFGALITQPVHDKNFKNKILLGSYIVAACFISASYKTVLASLLAIPVYNSIPETFEQLAASLRRKELKVFAPRGTAYMSIMISSGDENLYYIAQEIEKNQWLLPVDEYLNEDKFANRSAILVSKMLHNFKFGPSPWSRKFISNDIMFYSKTSIIVNKKFCCKGMLDSIIKRFNSAGIFKRILDDEIYRSWIRSSKNRLEIGKRRAFSLEDISCPFLLLLTGYSLSVIVLLGEISFSFTKSRQSET